MDRDISASLAEAARRAGRAPSVDEALETIVEAARTSLPGFEHVGISTVDRRGNVETRAQTGEIVQALDEIQYDLGEGPCLDALREAPIVAVPHVRHDQRWPRYVPEAVKLGLKSQLAVKLYLDDEGTMGGLNIYSTSTEDIDPDAVVAADLFASYAALVLGRTREVQHLNEALRSREVIGKALGLVMAEYALDEQAAFAFLARVSSHSNEKLRDVAVRMIEAHAHKVRSRT